jgi:hypothetical protein
MAFKFPIAEEKKEDVTMFNEDRAKYLGCLYDREVVTVLLGTVTASVIEHDDRKRTGACWLPQESFEVKRLAISAVCGAIVWDDWPDAVTGEQPGEHERQ